MAVLAWIVGLVLAVGIFMAGLGKVQGQAMMEASRDRLGVAPGMWKAIGGLELLAAVGLVIGLFTDGQNAEWIGFLAAVGIILVTIGATVYHLRAGDPPKEAMPAVMMLILAVLYIIFIGAR